MSNGLKHEHNSNSKYNSSSQTGQTSADTVARTGVGLSNSLCYQTVNTLSWATIASKTFIVKVYC